MKMIRTTLLLVALALVLAAAGCDGTTETGLLQGLVTIGPIQPVELPGVTATIPPEVYEARKVLVYNEAGSRLIKTVDLGPDGRYRIELAPGTYTVDINYLGVDSSDDVPRQIEIKSGLTVRVDIDIDTGIR
jgi:hypothetical protein